jgi:hypothetical protein
MGRNRNHRHQSLPVSNYNSAIARAVGWLGDRYLLAKPINAQPSSATQTASNTAGQERA